MDALLSLPKLTSSSFRSIFLPLSSRDVHETDEHTSIEICGATGMPHRCRVIRKHPLDELAQPPQISSITVQFSRPVKAFQVLILSSQVGQAGQNYASQRQEESQKSVFWFFLQIFRSLGSSENPKKTKKARHSSLLERHELGSQHTQELGTMSGIWGDR